MIFVKNSRGGREVNMINTLSKIDLSKIRWEGGGSTSIWIMSLNILFFFSDGTPKASLCIRQLSQEICTTQFGKAKGLFLKTSGRIVYYVVR